MFRFLANWRLVALLGRADGRSSRCHAGGGTACPSTEDLGCDLCHWCSTVGRPGAMQEVEQRAPPLRTLVAISAIGAAVEFTWSSGEVVIEPFLLQFWQSSTASLVFLANPVISLWLQPLLGQASDDCTSRFGRRRPFIVVLTITGLVGLSLLFFSCAQCTHTHLWSGPI